MHSQQPRSQELSWLAGLKKLFNLPPSCRGKNIGGGGGQWDWFGSIFFSLSGKNGDRLMRWGSFARWRKGYSGSRCDFCYLALSPPAHCWVWVFFKACLHKVRPMRLYVKDMPWHLYVFQYSVLKFSLFQENLSVPLPPFYPVWLPNTVYTYVCAWTRTYTHFRYFEGSNLECLKFCFQVDYKI